jgi:alpha-glucosidase
MLQLYRDALGQRREPPPDASIRWRPAEDGVLVFERPCGLISATNLTGEPVPIALPDGAETVLASGELDGATLPPDTSAWFRR